ncbi:MAG: hypothetical protein LUG60_08980, partial [Erysipelotrichaceae bacterium]|nr:hypothetical protein [Erysipelotrichaceae bacterium]
YYSLSSSEESLKTFGEYEIIISPYQDMGNEIDDSYQPYKYIYMLASIIENSSAKCVLRYPFWILRNQNHWNLLLTSLNSLIHTFGFNPLKNWKIMIDVDNLSDLTNALEMKNKIIESTHMEVIVTFCEYGK